MQHYFLALFFGTFLLEDVSLVAAIALIAEGKITLAVGFTACFLGIALGDIGLYVLGHVASHPALASRIKFLKKHAPRNPTASLAMGYSIAICRAVPGTRLPVYFAAGFFRYSFPLFLMLTAFTVFLWVALALGLGHSLKHSFHLHPWLSSVGLLCAFAFLQSFLPSIFNRWKRKALLHCWRRWLSFEFWPAWLFYLPIIPCYFYHSIRKGSFLLPFYANPEILNGGLIGESKWDFLRWLNKDHPTTLPTLLLGPELSFPEIEGLLISSEISYPFILKPDVGQRGYGVRIIKSPAELEEYVKETRGIPILAQTFSQFPLEAGIFYCRRPSKQTGEIFSITDKEFPFVVGDGSHSLGELILRDSRARIIAGVYFARLQGRLEEIIPAGIEVALSECGNHCQGAIFLNGASLKTEALSRRIEEIARGVPAFHFGRFDVRYQSHEQLQQGLAFEIVEINGAGAEATHIWDSRTHLLEAYQVLFAQWRILFDIGAEVKASHPNARIRLPQLFAEIFRVARRSDSLSISS